MSAEAGFQALVDLAAKTQTNSLPIPAEVDEIPRLSGIGFSLLGRRFIAPMGQVSEMLEMPAYTRLPGVQAWVIGLSNVRGRLLPLFDMAGFFGGAALGQRRQQRILVIDNELLYSGLVVDQAFGMQHFTAELYRDDVGDVPETMQPFVKGGYVDNSGVSWALFDMKAIANYSRFMNAASA